MNHITLSNISLLLIADIVSTYQIISRYVIKLQLMTNRQKPNSAPQANKLRHACHFPNAQRQTNKSNNLCDPLHMYTFTIFQVDQTIDQRYGRNHNKYWNCKRAVAAAASTRHVNHSVHIIDWPNRFARDVHFVRTSRCPQFDWIIN